MCLQRDKHDTNILRLPFCLSNKSLIVCPLTCGGKTTNGRIGKVT